jgi:hypothetical protein
MQEKYLNQARLVVRILGFLEYSLNPSGSSIRVMEALMQHTVLVKRKNTVLKVPGSAR